MITENDMPDYKVTVEGSDPRPIRAKTRKGAANHAVLRKVKVEELTIDDAMAFGKAGVEIEVAGAEAEAGADAGEATEG